MNSPSPATGPVRAAAPTRRLMRTAVALLLIAAVATPAAGGDAEGLLDRVRKKYDSVTDATLTFTQETRFAAAGINSRVDGKLLLKKSNRYRVEVEGQTIVTDGRTVWSYAASTHQVLVDSFRAGERMLTPERLLTAAPEEYSPRIIGEERIGSTETVVLLLTPKQGSSQVKSLTLWVDDDTALVRQALLVDVNGRETKYTVRAIDVNTGIEDGRFVFDVPDGAEIVDLR